MALLSNFRWQNLRERPNLSTINGDMVHRPKRLFVYEGVIESVSDNLAIDKLSF